MQRLMHIWAQVEQKLVNPAVMRQPFEAAGTRRIDALDLHWPVPVAGAGNGSRVGAKANQLDGPAEPFAAKLVDVQSLEHHAHFASGSVADVRIMRPDHR